MSCRLGASKRWGTRAKLGSRRFEYLATIALLAARSPTYAPVIAGSGLFMACVGSHRRLENRVAVRARLYPRQSAPPIETAAVICSVSATRESCVASRGPSQFRAISGLVELSGRGVRA